MKLPFFALTFRDLGQALDIVVDTGVPGTPVPWGLGVAPNARAPRCPRVFPPSRRIRSCCLSSVMPRPTKRLGEGAGNGCSGGIAQYS
jgi:hypothetical protein